ncbi:unnamed protein product [Amoebophrya sp. A120]|nr:unnamed protein product [Amoebophrya sp. A120]|eukprot:GSA120T00013910001.1
MSFSHSITNSLEELLHRFTLVPGTSPPYAAAHDDPAIRGRHSTLFLQDTDVSTIDATSQLVTTTSSPLPGTSNGEPMMLITTTPTAAGLHHGRSGKMNNSHTTTTHVVVTSFLSSPVFKTNWDPSPGDTCFGVHSQAECCSRCWKQVRRANAAEEPVNQVRVEDNGSGGINENTDPDDFVEEGAYTYYKIPSTAERLLYFEQTPNEDGNCCCKQGPYPVKKHLNGLGNQACFTRAHPEAALGLAVSGPTGSKKCGKEELKKNQITGIVRPGTAKYSYTRLLPPLFYIPFIQLFIMPLPWNGFFSNECLARCISTPGCVSWQWTWKPRVEFPYAQLDKHQSQEILRFVPIRMGQCQLKGFQSKEMPADGSLPPPGYNFQDWRPPMGNPDPNSIGMWQGKSNEMCGDDTPTQCEMDPSLQGCQKQKSNMSIAGAYVAGLALLPFLLLMKGVGGAKELINYTAGVKSELGTEVKGTYQGSNEFCKWWAGHSKWYRHGLDRQIYKIDEATGNYIPTYEPLPYDNMLSAQDNVKAQQNYCENVLHGCFDANYLQHTTLNPTWSSVRDVHRAANFRIEATNSKDPGFQKAGLGQDDYNPENVGKQAEEAKSILKSFLDSFKGMFGFSSETSEGDVSSKTSKFGVQLNQTGVHQSPLCLAMPVAQKNILKTPMEKAMHFGKPIASLKNFHPATPEVRKVDGKVTTLAKMIEKRKAEGMQYQKWLTGDASKITKGQAKGVVGKQVSEMKSIYGYNVGWKVPPKSFLEDANAGRAHQRKSMKEKLINEKNNPVLRAIQEKNVVSVNF